MNYAKIIKNDFTAGQGVCVTIYLTGCPIHCPGCHNPELWNPSVGTEVTYDTLYELVEDINANGIQRNLCIMGGEPFADCNLQSVAKLTSYIREKCPNIKIYVWTGFQFEDMVCPSALTILKNIDYLIDGPYVQEQRDITLKMRGSKNQRILELKNGKILREL